MIKWPLNPYEEDEYEYGLFNAIAEKFITAEKSGRMSFKNYTDDVMMTSIRILFWMIVIVGWLLLLGIITMTPEYTTLALLYSFIGGCLITWLMMRDDDT